VKAWRAEFSWVGAGTARRAPSRSTRRPSRCSCVPANPPGSHHLNTSWTAFVQNFLRLLTVADNFLAVWCGFVRNQFILATTADIDYVQEIRGLRRVLLENEDEEARWMVSIPFTRSIDNQALKNMCKYSASGSEGLNPSKRLQSPLWSFPKSNLRTEAGSGAQDKTEPTSPRSRHARSGRPPAPLPRPWC